MDLTSILDNHKSDLTKLIKDKFGLEGQEINKTLDSTKESIGETFVDKFQDFGMGTLLNLFSKEKNTKSSDSLLEGFGGNLLTKLLSKGFDKKTAAQIKSVVLPFVTNLFSKKINGKVSALKGLFGKSAGGLLGDLFSNYTFLMTYKWLSKYKF